MKKIFVEVDSQGDGRGVDKPPGPSALEASRS